MENKISVTYNLEELTLKIKTSKPLSDDEEVYYMVHALGMSNLEAHRTIYLAKHMNDEHVTLD